MKGYVSGSLAVPSLSSPEHLDFSAAVLFHGSLTFFRPPLTRAGGPLLAHLRLLALPLGLLGPGAVSPVSPSPSPGPFSPGGASVIRARSGRVSTAPRYLRPSAALSTGRGASRRRPTSESVAASGSSLPAALARRAPTGGFRLGRASTAQLPTRPGAVLVGDARALPLPVPARAPLLARLGVLASDAVFPSPAVHRRLAAPCVPPCSFPCL